MVGLTRKALVNQEGVGMPKGETEFPHQRTVHFGAEDIQTAQTAKEKYGMAISTLSGAPTSSEKGRA